MNWWNGLKIKAREREPLRKHTTFKIGGRAEYFFEPGDADELKSLLSLLKRRKIPILALGAGSNILASDKDIDAAIIRLSSPYFKGVKFKGSFVEAGSGLMLNQLLLASKRRGLSGAEFLAGIPGTVGGALIMNAGLKEESIADIVESVTVIDYNGGVKTLPKTGIKFEYRQSSLSKYIIVSAVIKLAKKDKRDIADRIAQYLTRRRLSQDLSYPSAGCVFKNPRGYSAGQLIDLCGLKGRRSGGACVSRRHANFILNKGNAKAKDVFALMDLIGKEVRSKFKIKLEPEIKIWR